MPQPQIHLGGGNLLFTPTPLGRPFEQLYFVLIFHPLFFHRNSKKFKGLFVRKNGSLKYIQLFGRWLFKKLIFDLIPLIFPFTVLLSYFLFPTFLFILFRCQFSFSLTQTLSKNEGDIFTFLFSKVKAFLSES